MQKATPIWEGVQRYEFEPNTNFPAQVPPNCKTSCECKLYFPCINTKHNPCRFNISLEANHTHIIVEIIRNGIAEERKICVSPKCLGTFQLSASEDYSRTQTPPVRCYRCYLKRELKKDAKVILNEDNSQCLLWTWRRSIPG